VGDEEKKLSFRRASTDAHSQKDEYKAHCFPDISTEDLLNNGHCASLSESFKRQTFDTIGSSQGKFVSGFGDSCASPKNAASLAEIEKQAYQKGFIDGEKQGVADGERVGFDSVVSKVETLMKSFQEALLQIKNVRNEIYHRIEKEVVELSLAIAKKVICQEIKTDREVVVCVAREALNKVEDTGNIKIKMSPDDLNFINETKYQISNLIEHIDNVTVEAEDSIPNGGCIIETEFGDIDARIEKQLQAIEESFLSGIENPSQGG